MAYRDFTFSDLYTKFGIEQSRKKLFDKIVPQKPSDLLLAFLDTASDAALSTEKAVSEALVYPILQEIRLRNRSELKLFSDKAIKKTGKKTLVMCGLWTEVCLSQTVITGLKLGYDIYFVSDCSGGTSKEAHDDAKVLMTLAGAKPINWQAVMATCCPDNTSPEYSRLYDPVIRHGNGVSYAVQYVMANLK